MKLSEFILALQNLEISEDAGTLPVCVADWAGTFQSPVEVSILSAPFESYKDNDGFEKIGKIIKLGA